MTEKLYKGAIFIVPKQTLEAYLIINNENKKVIDQTIWIIDDYKNGYIFGTSYTMIDNIPFSKNSFVGSITPKCDVQISFYTNSGERTSGTGFFNGRSFLMQMNEIIDTNNNLIGLSHWSYMKYINHCSKYYYSLPGVGISVPDFIAKFSN